MESHDAEFREGDENPYAYSRNARANLEGERPKAKVILFKPSGKYYTEEEWEIPTREEVIERGGNAGDSVGPYCMKFSKDFRRIDWNGSVLVETQEPWDYPYPYLFLGI